MVVKEHTRNVSAQAPCHSETPRMEGNGLFLAHPVRIAEAGEHCSRFPLAMIFYCPHLSPEWSPLITRCWSRGEPGKLLTHKFLSDKCKYFSPPVSCFPSSWPFLSKTRCLCFDDVSLLVLSQSVLSVFCLRNLCLTQGHDSISHGFSWKFNCLGFSFTFCSLLCTLCMWHGGGTNLPEFLVEDSSFQLPVDFVPVVRTNSPRSLSLIWCKTTYHCLNSYSFITSLVVKPWEWIYEL